MCFMSHPMPNFFVVGAPKAGTTSLYHYLDQHPDVYMSPIKEPNYFASEIRPEIFSDEMRPAVDADLRDLQRYLHGPMTEKRFGGIVTDWDDYLRLFRNVKGEKAIGEASVCYLWSNTAAANIQAKIPHARILMILRDPVDRMFSQYLQMVSEGRSRITFRQHIENQLARHHHKLREPHLELALSPLGFSADDVQRYIDRFPPQNLRIFLYEDYRQQQARVLADTFRFLGVDAGFAPDTSQRHLQPRVPRSLVVGHFLKKTGLWQRAAKLAPTLLRPFLRQLAVKPRGALQVNSDDRKFLQDRFRDDIRRLEVLLGRDLSTWLQ